MGIIFCLLPFSYLFYESATLVKLVILVLKEFVHVFVDGFGEGGEDVSSSSPSVDSTTPGDLDTLNIPNTDVKTKFDVGSTGDGSYGMLDPTNSANSSTSKGSEKAMYSEEEQSANTRLNETAKTTPKSEGQHTPELGLPADGLITTVKTDHDAGKVDLNSSHTPVGSPTGLPVPSSTSQQQQHNIHQQQKQALHLASDNVSTSLQSTKCGTSDQHVSASGNVLSPGSSGSKPDTQERENKDMVISSPSGVSPPASSDKELLNGVIRQGPQNVTVTTPARMNPHCFGSNNVYPHGQPHPRGMSPAVMNMPHGGAMAMSSNNNLGPMSPMNNVSPPQASVPPQMRHSGYTSPNQQSNYSHPNAQFNPQVAHQTVPMPPMNGQGFGNFRGDMTHNNRQWYGQMAMANERRPFPQRRTMRSPQGMSQYPQECYSPQGFPSQGQPNPQQNPHGFGNQYNQIQKNIPFGSGAYSGQSFNDHPASQFGMVVPGPNSQHGGGNYNHEQNFEVGGPHGSGTMGSAGSTPGPSSGVPLVHHQQGANTTAVGGTGRVDGSFGGYHSNPLTHFPAGREPPTPPAGPGGTGQVSSTVVSVNSNNSMAGSNHHTQQRSGNFNSNYGPHLNSSPHSHQQHQLHNNRTVEPHQMYTSMDNANMNPQCPPNNTPPFSAQYNSPYTNQQQQQAGSHDTGNNNQVTSSGDDVTNPMGGSGDIPEFSMFGDYAPQNDYY